MIRALRPSLICALCGLILALPYRWYEGSLPVWFALAPVFWIVAHAQNTRRALLCAASFTLCWTGSSFMFLRNVAPAGMVALTLYTSLFYLAALLGVSRLAQRGTWCAVFGTAALWALVEIVRSRVPVFGFPWLLLGHSLLYNEWLRQGADVLGVFGLSFLLAAFNAWLAFVAAPRQEHGRGVSEILAALFMATLIYGAYRVHTLEPHLQPGPPIVVIQGNILQKLDRTSAELTAQVNGHMELHRQAVEKARAAGIEPVLVCWAETMVPGALNTDDDYGRPFREQAAALGIPTLCGSNFTVDSGSAEHSGDPDNYNAAYIIDGTGKEVCHYFKRRLVPFGEYIPFTARFPFLKALRSVTRDRFLPGSEPSSVCTIPMGTDSAPNYRIALNICVEDIHPDLAREGALAGADTLLNLTNDGWFYDTDGARAHMLAAAWRAIEVRRPLLRVTNTGHTVAVDPLGRIHEVLPPWTVGTALVNLKRVASGGPAATWTMGLGELGAGVIFFGIFIASLIWSKNRT